MAGFDTVRLSRPAPSPPPQDVAAKVAKANVAAKALLLAKELKDILRVIF